MKTDEREATRHLLARALARIQGGHEPGIQNDLIEAIERARGTK